MAIPTSYEQVTYNSPDGAQMGKGATEKIAFYGSTPVVQRASAVQAASVVSATSYISVTSNLAAFCAEVAATLTGLGIWKGTA
jgi:hypothetical protein